MSAPKKNLPKKSLLWITEVFASEFGNSDVQSNYSRLYAWMANQLGHMTLGLATALAFVWIYETLRHLASWSDGGMFSSLGAFWLHIAGFLMLAGTAAFLVFVRFQGLFGGKKFEHRNRVYVLPPTLGLWIGAAVALALLAVWFRILQLQPGTHDSALMDVYALAAASLVILGAVVILAKDWRALVLGGLFVFAAFWLIASDTAVLVHARQPVALFLMVALGAVLFATARTYDSSHDKVRGPNAMLNAAVLLILSIMLFIGLDAWASHLDGLAADWIGIAEPQWRIAFGASIAALALWLVKEFGSDIPLVSEEVAKAADVRQRHGHVDYKEIERAYFMDAVWDARTDGAFYVTGAVIAVGLLTDTGTMLTAWASGPDFLGVLFFGLIFLISGRRWAYRQQALDLVGSPYASRLAVLQNAIELRVVLGDKLGPPRDRPLSVMLEFARGGIRRVGQVEDLPTLVNFDHLLILGRLGSGKTPLGIALSSEASLRDLEAKIGIPFMDPIRPRKSAHSKTEVSGEPYEEAGRRAAAYTTLKNLYTMVRHVETSPKEQILDWLNKDWIRRNLIGLRPKDATVDDLASLPGPVDLLVVDDVNLALPGAPISGGAKLNALETKQLQVRQLEAMRESQDVEMLREIMPALPQDRDQHTVWMVDVTSLPEFVRSADPDQLNAMHDMPDTLVPLVQTLSFGLRRPQDGSPARIAVAFVDMSETMEV